MVRVSVWFVVGIAVSCLSVLPLVSAQAQILKPQATPAQKLPTAKPRAPKPSATAALIACPPDSRTACDSFTELWKAGDTDVRLQLHDFGMVCFRQKEDTFLVFMIAAGNFDYDRAQRNLDGPSFIRSWSHAAGHLVAFKDGVQNEDDSVPQQLALFRGTWTSFATADRYDTKRSLDAFYVAKSEDNQGVFVNVDEITAEVSVSYKNVNNEDVGYDFNIQLATGRFVEKHTFRSRPAARTSGRCVPLPRVE